MLAEITHQCGNIPEKMTKTKTMLEFVFHLRDMTKSELCKTYPNTFVMPTWKGNQDDMVKDMLAFDAILWRITGEYGKFLKRQLKKGMFVPCDKDDNILEEPISYDGMDSNDYLKLKEYNQAKDRVLFKVFKVVDLKGKGFHSHVSKAIMDDSEIIASFWFSTETSSWGLSRGTTNISSICHYSFELTDRALKEIGLD
jgi:hypothetical protein